MPKIVPENKARQGRRGQHVLRILIAALLLAFIGWGVAEIYGWMIETPKTEQGNTPSG
ncbi:hypothetical protein NKH24_00185 [Mesorhizobium sp. M1300]|uniref:hypothetical protein n=1 Tax=Mesorhizobium sp. M1300 TaxID=2957077 RepID=UPI00333611DE